MTYHLIWGCNPDLQLETAWIYYLLAPNVSAQSYLYHDNSFPEIMPGTYPILIESGILRLHRNLSAGMLFQHDQDRISRLSWLKEIGLFGVIHLSDEEGLDADSWYHLLPIGTQVWRNFFHERLVSAVISINTFPIGPRQLFIDNLHSQDTFLTSSKRSYPWSFMGTLWPSGSRMLATSLFLTTFPSGYHYGGKSFGQGLSLPDYRSILTNSSFALSPEGDRHLDTFRLWESLSCGSIPLVVDFNNSAHALLPAPHPIPVFKTWFEARDFVNLLLYDSTSLDLLQYRISKSTLR